ncbi:hypothetical protein [Carboxylicivirga sp. RSCT41]|uniref:hypothetical protein n=1 Tax=Carboxylicivirga agarovorans TaxID=3417570 RepID=UPI003D356EF4
MDDIGNILYILAMLAALIFSAYKKQKQSKRPMQAPDEPMRPETESMGEEDVFEELRELFQNPKPKPQPVVQEPKVVKKEMPLHMQKKEVLKKTEHAKEEPVKLVSIDEESEGFEFDKEQIDLRQAVIYSEILKRPYE